MRSATTFPKTASLELNIILHVTSSTFASVNDILSPKMLAIGVTNLIYVRTYC